MKKNKYIAPTIDLVNINVEFVCQSGPSLTPRSSPGDAWEAEDNRRPIKVKKHGRPAQSLFRAGLDRLVSVLFRGMRLLEILGGEVMDLLVVKEDVG